ncbi:MAG: type II toxin-antitoxin system RelE/ParE family toxin [Mesorhizobium sp.]|uniref:type II toxin-antitoxin system RelE/ParE family toxin n=1 Tax=Mesorhizobium sp. TaxID=1871066 RepID=UPI000FD503F4|nr:type II toxin-antitoxin system RelE/ParE family toxin [Mesorhizobium sp.]RVC40895.1 type II toxin-antitoxin system RelE/ParE family toxin [Mesorhizobium sp. M4B.F.Ca.ET.088.02.2.1]RWC95895.1 MAG: type II toxin-antitoxin system RelE/ParE family toxin [Mesorhizobium sp.]RWF28158.1 MAG: type II toxin-antitoxin system RelE/ParE family toxin [Mesorhizobium sp.]RWF39035.1 MAG: type II toxin-antitoxin system RelE/ParE family toxin [Mesorhizobium sp.]TIW68933.1 MAG: type II toxin-antitoxin system R
MIQRLAVVLREEAISDLEAIAAYVLDSSRSETTANGFIDRIKDRCLSIGNAPRGGRSRDDIVPGLRTVPFEHSAVIAYVIEDDFVHIVRIFYGGRDYETLMRGDEPS